MPKLFQRARAAVGTASYACKGGADMPIAITEWGPNTIGTNVVIPMSTATAAPAGSQIAGLFAAESYANFMEQGAMAAHWLELHNNSYLAGIDATNDPFTMVNDSPRWGYHAAQIAHFLAGGGDRMVQGDDVGDRVRNAGEVARLRARQRRHRGHDDQHQPQRGRGDDGERHRRDARAAWASATPTRRSTPIRTATVTGDWIYANTAGTAVTVLVPKYSSVVVVFPKR